MKGHTYILRLVRAVMPEGREVMLLLLWRYNLLVEMSEMYHPSKGYTYILNHVIFVNHGGYRGDSVVAKTRPIGVT